MNPRSRLLNESSLSRLRERVGVRANLAAHFEHPP